MNPQDINFKTINSLNRNLITSASTIEINNTERNTVLLNEATIDIKSTNSLYSNKISPDSILLSSENSSTQVPETSFQKPVDLSNIINPKGTNKRLASIFTRDYAPKKKNISSVFTLDENAVILPITEIKDSENIIADRFNHELLSLDTEEKISPSIPLEKSADFFSTKTNIETSEIVIISSSPDSSTLDLEKYILPAVTLETGTEFPSTLTDFKASENVIVSSSPVSSPLELKKNTPSVIKLEASAELLASLIEIKAPENTAAISSNSDSSPLNKEKKTIAMCYPPLNKRSFSPQIEINSKCTLENNKVPASNFVLIENVPKSNFSESKILRILPSDNTQNNQACKSKGVTLSTLPNLDPRIPKIGNVVLAKSGDRARRLLRAIDVNQTAVKRTGSSDDSSTEDETSTLGGLDDLLSENPKSSVQITKNERQPISPTIHTLEKKALIIESRSSSEESSVECSDSSDQSTRSSDVSSHSITEITTSSSNHQEINTSTIKINEPKNKLVLTDPYKYKTFSSLKPSSSSKRAGNLISTPKPSLDAHSSYLSKFEKVILRWDFNISGHLPVNFGTMTSSYKTVSSMPSKFNSIQEYKAILEPLFFLECWAQIQKSKEEVFIEDTVLGKLFSFNQGPEFNELKIKLSGSISQLIENDLILITLDYNTDLNKKAPRLQNANMSSKSESESSYTPLTNVTSNNIRILGKVYNSGFKGDNIIDVRCCFSCNSQRILSLLKPNNAISFLRLTNLSHLYRDFHALQELSTYPLVKDIIDGYADKNFVRKVGQIDRLISEYQLNKSQALAILSSASMDKGFSIIQGPPGTGKTKTISGLVAVLLNQFNNDTIDQTIRPQKLLICAPSNAAVDEIISRLKKSLPDSIISKKLIRVGVVESIHPSVHEQTLDYMLDSGLRSKASSDYIKAKSQLDTFDNEINSLRENLTKLKSERNEIREIQRKNTSHRGNKIFQLSNGIKIIEKKIDLKSQLRAATFRSAESIRTSLRNRLLEDAEIICSTLSGAGHEMMKSISCNFETVIIDEAAQSVELASLIPLRYGCTRCIMIGDPHQLPPTVISSIAAKSGYNNSLFSRIFNNNRDAAHLLDVQYRMHPLISQLPSALFYDNKLHDASNLQVSKAAPWHSSSLFPPFCFYNVLGSEETTFNHSKLNLKECEAACAIANHLFDLYPTIDFKGLIGIITPYKSQVRKMKQVFIARFGKSVLDDIEFNTIDGFQGQEKDIIIFSCVRAGKDHEIGFLADVRRMNVGLTRAQKSLIVIGRSETLSLDINWDILVTNSKKREVYYEFALIFKHIFKNRSCSESRGLKSK